MNFYSSIILDESQISTPYQQYGQQCGAMAKA